MNRLINTLKTFKPTMITFTDPMEEDSDHAGVGLFTLTAVDKWIKNSIILENEKSNLNSRAVTKNQISAPRLFAYLIHWHHWPLQDIPDQPVDISHAPLIFPKEFPKRDLKRVCIPLQKNERELKRNVLMKYKTQQQAMGGYLSMFINSTECFSQIELNDFSDIQSTVELWQKSPENPEIVPLKLCNKKPCPAYQLR